MNYMYNTPRYKQHSAESSQQGNILTKRRFIVNLTHIIISKINVDLNTSTI